ncbi:hypothetical protein HK100_006625 [Physocladia obscura]|uniref:Thioredoxin domain-containing protein n=1 Tax=Physocladia obscura TaxID=109957 RepID=A0AAD5T667_9FUNG|nr:hypothetical protein HK100_006625 [Physocladia obscura]
MFPGSSFPILTVPLVSGGETTVKSDGTNAKLVVIYRAWWCPFCNETLKSLVANVSKLTDAGIDVIAVSADPKEKAEQLVKDIGINFPIGYGLNLDQLKTLGTFVSDPAWHSQLPQKHLFSEPAWFLVDQNNNIKYLDYGSAPFSGRPNIDALVKGYTWSVQNAKTVIWGKPYWDSEMFLKNVVVSNPPGTVNEPILYHPISAYPANHWALHVQSESDPHFIGHIHVDSLVYVVYANPTDSTCLRLIVALADLTDMRTTLNRTYSEDEECGLALVAARVRVQMQVQFGLIVQVMVLGNNAHGLNHDGRICIGNNHEPGFLHAHLISRGNPERVYAGTDPIGGPALGKLFVMEQKQLWSESHLRCFVEDMRECLKEFTRREVLPRSFYFIRHGQTDYNLQERLQGHIDSNLTDFGVQQAEIAGQVLANIASDVNWVVSSSLQRARHTSDILRRALPSSLSFEMYDGLRENNFGVLEGRLLSSISQAEFDAVIGGDQKNAESFPRFLNRVHYTINLILSLHPDGPGLVVSHGGVFCALLELTGQSVFESENAVVWRFDPPLQNATAWTVTRIKNLV